MTRDPASAAPRLYHTVTAHIRDYDGTVYWTAGPCPRAPDDPHRDCRMGVEAVDCVWELWEAGDCHHPSCGTWPNRRAAHAECETHPPTLTGDYACWEGVPEPDECDGWSHPEVGHMHPTPGCYLTEAVSMGPEEGFIFEREFCDVPIVGPMPVRLGWDPDGTLVLCPVDAAEVEAGDVR